MKIFDKTQKRLLHKPTAALCARWPAYATIKLMRKYNELLLTIQELQAIINAVRAKPACNFLVFGLGNDSRFWAQLNRTGQTVFLEDDQAWFANITKKNPHLTAHRIDYHSRLSQADELLGSPAVFDLALPPFVRKIQWDVILVDAPLGWGESAPGRMKSIAAASRLVRNDGDVFVHDCDRPVEKNFSEKYLRRENLVAEVGRLRHFRMEKRTV